MKVITTRRAATIASCVLIMGQSPHCPEQVYFNYHFELEGCPGEAFNLPDSAVRGEYKLRSTNRKSARPCPGFKLYDLVEENRGLANPDFIHPDVYVRLERGAPCRLRVILVATPVRSGEPTSEGETIAQLVMQGSTTQPRLPAAAKKEQSRDALEYWCGRQKANAEASLAAAGSLPCTPATPDELNGLLKVAEAH